MSFKLSIKEFFRYIKKLFQGDKQITVIIKEVDDGI